MITVKRAVLRFFATMPIWARPWIVANGLLVIAGGCGLPPVPLEWLAVAAVSQAVLSAMGDISWTNRRVWSGAVTTRAFALVGTVLTGLEATPYGDAALILAFVSTAITCLIFRILGHAQRRNYVQSAK